MLIAAGCSSDRGPRGAGEGPRIRAATPMAGQELFFDAQLLAKITVGNEGMPRLQPGGGGSERGSGGRRSGGGGRPPRNAGLGGGGFDLGPGGGHREGGGGGDAPARPMMGMGGGAPVIIHVSFTNQGAAPVELWIADFTSLLGNFAIQPEKLALAPGQTLELEPMSSQLGGIYSEVDATLVLRIGDRREQKTFRLHALPAPANPETTPQ